MKGAGNSNFKIHDLKRSIAHYPSPIAHAQTCYGNWLLSLLLVVFVSLTLLLEGCQPTDFRTRVAQGSQLALSTVTDPNTFNFANKNTFPNIFLFTYEGLTNENGVTGEIEPALAESWKISQDKQHVVFKLRPGLKWSDGEPLTADDVVFTYMNIVANPDIPTDAKEGIQIGSNKAFPNVRKLDELTVEFILPEPFAPLLRATAGPDGILIQPKHALESTLKAKGTDGNLKFLSTWGPIRTQQRWSSTVPI